MPGSDVLRPLETVLGPVSFSFEVLMSGTDEITQRWDGKTNS